jgi:hypothetical protein
MKTKNLLIAALLAALSLTTTAVAQVVPTVVQPTASQYADGYSRYPAKYYTGGASFNETNNLLFTIQQVAGHWGFTRMSVNGVELPIDPDEPLLEFPRFMKGRTLNFGLYANGYDDAGHATRWGNFYTPELKQGDTVRIVVSLADVSRSIPWSLSGGQTPDNTGIQDDQGRQGWYDSRSGSWVVYYDPLNPPARWIVYDKRDNSVIVTIPFSEATPVVSESNGFALQNEGDVPEFELNSSGGWMLRRQGLPLNHDVEYFDAQYHGKVMIARVSSATDYMQVRVSNLRLGSIVRVYGYDDEWKPIHAGDWQLNHNGMDLQVQNVTGFTSYKLIVVGALLDPIPGFGITVFDSSGPWGYGSGGVGVGIVELGK